MSRARREALEAPPRSRLNEALLELVRCHVEDDQVPEVLTAGCPVHINFGRGNKAKVGPPPCQVCGWISDRLCDWKLPGGVDCDVPLCSYCTFSPAPEKDICPLHVGPLKVWLSGRTNTIDGAG